MFFVCLFVCSGKALINIPWCWQSSPWEELPEWLSSTILEVTDRESWVDLGIWWKLRGLVLFILQTRHFWDSLKLPKTALPPKLTSGTVRDHFQAGTKKNNNFQACLGLYRISGAFCWAFMFARPLCGVQTLAQLPRACNLQGSRLSKGPLQSRGSNPEGFCFLVIVDKIGV